MTVEDVMELFIDSATQKVEIFDLAVDSVVFAGTAEEVPAMYEGEEVASIDNLIKGSDVFTVNIYNRMD